MPKTFVRLSKDADILSEDAKKFLEDSTMTNESPEGVLKSAQKHLRVLKWLLNKYEKEGAEAKKPDAILAIKIARTQVAILEEINKNALQEHCVNAEMCVKILEKHLKNLDDIGIDTEKTKKNLFKLFSGHTSTT